MGNSDKLNQYLLELEFRGKMPHVMIANKLLLAVKYPGYIVRLI